jgi:sugar phosphate isomerase/epimerase
MSRDIYFSFFMFTANLRPDDRAYTKIVVQHMKELRQLGYVGFDLPIAPTDTRDHRAEVESYVGVKRALDEAGLDDVAFTTNVAATRTFDPSSVYEQQREVALAYLKSRVEITAALGGSIMAGPIIFPYNVFPTTDANEPIWSDALQDWVVPRYAHAQPVIDELGEYAETKNVRLAIEPVDHWETPAPNMVADVVGFLDGVRSPQVGVCIDSAHVVLGSDGPSAFERDVARVAQAGRLNYVHISAPDRGAVKDSWIPWSLFLEPVLAGYDGPLLVETFNAVPAFLSSLHLTRRKFWIPGEDPPDASRPGAYAVAGEAIAAVRQALSELGAASATMTSPTP